MHASLIGGISDSDLAAGAALTLLSFLASVIQGSTSIGDGIFLQIMWGILQNVAPFVTTESSLGADGLRVITMFMYVRLVTMTPSLVYWLRTDRKKAVRKVADKRQRYIAQCLENPEEGANSIRGVSLRSGDQFISVADGNRASEVTNGNSNENIPINTKSTFSITTNSPSIGSTCSSTNSATSTAAELKAVLLFPDPSRIVSPRLFILITAPTIVWSVVGVMILKNIDSSVLSLYMGTVCITFSILYMALKLWKVSPAHQSMPLWVQSILSPKFSKDGTGNDNGHDSNITNACQVAFFFASNLCGLMVTLAGIGSPPMIIVVLLFNIPVSLTRFTLPVGATFGAVIRLAYALHAGMVTLDRWPFYIPATTAGLIGLYIGVRIGNVLTPSMYSAAIFVLLNLAGIVMLTSNTFVTVPILIMSTTALIFKHFWLDVEERRRIQFEAAQNALKEEEELFGVGNNNSSALANDTAEGVVKPNLTITPDFLSCPSATFSSSALMKAEDVNRMLV